jgi:hypothetical protein
MVTMRVWLSTWMRPRRSTWVLMALFALTLVTYLWLRPPPRVTTAPSGGTPVIDTRTSTPSLRAPTKDPTARPSTVSPTKARTAPPTTPPPTVTTTAGTPTPSGTPTTAPATTPAPTPT